MTDRAPDTTSLRTTFKPAGMAAYQLARALGRALGIPHQSTNESAYAREYKRLLIVAKRQGFDVAAWLKSRREVNLNPPDQSGSTQPAPRPPQTFED